jgi:hypothetical protein
MTFDGATWHKSSRSNGGGNGNCVEVAVTAQAVGVRDSKAGGVGPVLCFERDQWHLFVCGVRDGRFDL